MSKYRAIKTEKESVRYSELKLLVRIGKVRNLTLQPKFLLEVDGVKIGTYVADFQYERQDDNEEWEEIVEDVKGMKTPVYRLKKKLVYALHGFEIQEV